jgi:hypothetical protein
MKKFVYLIILFGATIFTVSAQKMILSNTENENGELIECYKNNNGEIYCNVYYIGSLADKFSSGLRRIEKNKKIGFIDKKGNIKITPQFSTAEKFQKKRCAVQNLGKESDKSATDGSAEIIWEDGLWGIIDKKGGIVKPFQYERKWNNNENCYEYYNDKERFILTEKGKIKKQ